MPVSTSPWVRMRVVPLATLARMTPPTGGRRMPETRRIATGPSHLRFAAEKPNRSPTPIKHHRLRYLLPTDWPTASARNDRERTNRTRQNAEDLFKPKPQTTRADVPNDDSSAEYQPRRQPRIFAIPPVVPMSTTKVEPAAEPKEIRRKAIDKRGTREVPLSQFGRVRTLTSYGMTPAQVAELYGVAVGEIDRIIRRPR